MTSVPAPQGAMHQRDLGMQEDEAKRGKMKKKKKLEERGDDGKGEVASPSPVSFDEKIMF